MNFDSDLITVAIFIIAFPVAISVGTYVIVNKISASPGIIPAPEYAHEITSSVDSSLGVFLQAHGFRFANAYRFHSIRLGDWLQAGPSAPSRRVMIALTATGKTCEFITEFSDHHSLTTTRSKAAFMFPRPYGSFIQSFPSATIDELWNQHMRGEEYLISDLSVPVGSLSLPFVEAFSAGALRQMRCIKSLRCWPVRGIYWFVLKRFLMHNRPIWKQNIPKLYLVAQ